MGSSCCKDLLCKVVYPPFNQLPALLFGSQEEDGVEIAGHLMLQNVALACGSFPKSKRGADTIIL